MSTNVTSTPSPPTTSVRVMPSTSGSTNSSTGLGSPGMNFFFGFLIAFIALLLFFVGCGYGARRSLMMRRRVLQRLELEEAEAAAPEGAVFGDLEGLVVMRKDETIKIPVFWDRWTESGASDEKKEWESMMPLGAMVVPEGVDEAPPPSLYSPLLATPNWLRPRTPEPRNWRRSIQSMIVMPFTLMFIDPRPTRSQSVETLSSALPPPPAGGAGDGASVAAISLHTLSRTGSRHPSVIQSPTPPEENNVLPSPTDDGDARKSSASEDPPVKQPSPPPLVNVQIMVMIAMPSDKKEEEEEEEQRIPQVQFGITRVPVMLCDDDESML